MELQGERLIPASVEATWAALNDPDVLKACIAGCETMERTADDALAATVAMKIGPVSARFKGKVQMTNVHAPTGYTLNFDGQGGVAGFGKGSADVTLAPEGEQTRLAYSARATVGGKMAQIGARLIDATAAKITEDFFSAFEARLRPPAAADAVAVADSDASRGPTAGDSAVTVPPPSPPSGADGNAGGGAKLVWWLIGAVIVLGAVYVMMKR